MNTEIIISIVSGVFSLISTIVVVYLTHHLESTNSNIGYKISAFINSKFFLVSIFTFVLGLLTSQFHYLLIIKQLFIIPATSLLIISLLAIYFALEKRKNRLYSAFLLESFALSTGFLAGWVLSNDKIWSGVLNIMFPFWLISSIIGLLVIYFSNKSTN